MSFELKIIYSLKFKRMKLWDKGYSIDKLIEKFTVGKDRELDLYLAKFDVLGSMAHIKMLESIDLLTKEELDKLLPELKSIYTLSSQGKFKIAEDEEDVHSQIETLLTDKLGDIGKKIHSGRSRNDQVLLDLKLYTRNEIQEVVDLTKELFDVLIEQANKYKAYAMPGYTHLQVAMPSSFGLWFSAWAESLTDDLLLLQSAYKITNQNPLGSAAGYGSSFPLNRQMTTDLLGFDKMNINVIYAQMGRGKMEKTVSFALSSIATTLSKIAFDICMFMCQNFGFISLPDELTTGSSIMPHKKNPDVFELIRAHCNKIQSLPSQITLMTNNLPSGYFRDYQILKEIFLPAFEELKDCLKLATYSLSKVSVKANILDEDTYKYVFSVESVNKLVMEGLPFRDAYKKIGMQIQKGEFKREGSVEYSHVGSTGNLCLAEITNNFNKNINEFNFEKVTHAIKELLKE